MIEGATEDLAWPTLHSVRMHLVACQFDILAKVVSNCMICDWHPREKRLTKDTFLLIQIEKLCVAASNP